mmetsp:Transcript_33960/g.74695  ORF Transcript_33960/g.74695 Transcript_33960/m.74695 type:complete len:272 (-) Transcript_33960:171-986(-)
MHILIIILVLAGRSAAAWISTVAPQKQQHLTLDSLSHRAYASTSSNNEDHHLIEPPSTPDGVPTCRSSPILGRRDVLQQSTVSAVAGLVLDFLTPSFALAYTPDSDKLRESLYLISRVQESTVQLERLIRNCQTQEELKPKLKLKLKLVQASYRLLDQINYASQFVDPPEELVAASEAGNIAVESLQDAVVYTNNELGDGPIVNEQREFLNEALQTTRESLFTFLKYMPQDKLEQARKRVEVENVDNRDEFDDNIDKNAGVYNPVTLPWKQ